MSTNIEDINDYEAVVNDTYTKAPVGANWVVSQARMSRAFAGPVL